MASRSPVILTSSPGGGASASSLKEQRLTKFLGWSMSTRSPHQQGHVVWKNESPQEICTIFGLSKLINALVIAPYGMK